MDYKFLRCDMPAWRNKPVYAKRIHPHPEGLESIVWDASPLPYQPELAFAVDGTAHLPDLLGTGGVLWLISHKFSELLQTWKIPFESFPVSLVDSKSNQLLKVEYALFHLMQIQPIIDLNKSNISPDRTVVESLVLKELARVSGYALVRDSFLRAHVFVREDLLEQMVNMNITGYYLEEVHQYRFSLRTNRW